VQYIACGAVRLCPAVYRVPDLIVEASTYVCASCERGLTDALQLWKGKATFLTAARQQDDLPDLPRRPVKTCATPAFCVVSLLPRMAAHVVVCHLLGRVLQCCCLCLVGWLAHVAVGRVLGPCCRCVMQHREEMAVTWWLCIICVTLILQQQFFAHAIWLKGCMCICSWAEFQVAQ
jgi:hypothetical protein